MLHGMLVRCVNDLLMTQMHAIKHADGECERTWDGGEFFEAKLPGILSPLLHPRSEAPRGPSE